MHEDDKKAILKKATDNGLQMRLMKKSASLNSLAISLHNAQTKESFADILDHIEKTVRSITNAIELIKEHKE